MIPSSPRKNRVKSSCGGENAVATRTTREIADIMTESGDYACHATVVKIINKAMEKFAGPVLEHYGQKATPERVKELALHPDFQSFIGGELQEIWREHGSITPQGKSKKRTATIETKMKMSVKAKAREAKKKMESV